MLWGELPWCTECSDLHPFPWHWELTRAAAKNEILSDFSLSLSMDVEIRLLGGEQNPLLSARTSPPIADRLNAVYFAALPLQGLGTYITSFSKPNNKHIRSCSSQVLQQFICKKNI